jgi:hypothetical protein
MLSLTVSWLAILAVVVLIVAVAAVTWIKPKGSIAWRAQSGA